MTFLADVWLIHPGPERAVLLVLAPACLSIAFVAGRAIGRRVALALGLR